MGVKGLWTLLDPSSKPLKLESLQGRRLAIDASIWLYQFMKAMRDSEGQPLPGAHIVGFLRRIIKLIFNGIKPVFVFDGGCPSLKKQTIFARREKRAKAEANHKRTAEKLLQNQLKLYAMDQLDEGRPRHHGVRFSNSASRDKDDYALPEQPIRSNEIDSRLATDSEIFDFIDNQRREIDLSKVNIDSAHFQTLPLNLQHEIILDLKMKSRTPNQERVNQMLQNSKTAFDFSKQQIKNLIHRSTLTERYHSSLKVDEVRRNVGTRQSHFVLRKSDQIGWQIKKMTENKKVIDGLKGLQGFSTDESKSHFNVESNVHINSFRTTDLDSYLIPDESNLTDNYDLELGEWFLNWNTFKPPNFASYYNNHESIFSQETFDMSIIALTDWLDKIKSAHLTCIDEDQTSSHFYLMSYLEALIARKTNSKLSSDAFDSIKKPESIYIGPIETDTSTSKRKLSIVSDCVELVETRIPKRNRGIENVIGFDDSNSDSEGDAGIGDSSDKSFTETSSLKIVIQEVDSAHMKSALKWSSSSNKSLSESVNLEDSKENDSTDLKGSPNFPSSLNKETSATLTHQDQESELLAIDSDSDSDDEVWEEVVIGESVDEGLAQQLSNNPIEITSEQIIELSDFEENDTNMATIASPVDYSTLSNQEKLESIINPIRNSMDPKGVHIKDVNEEKVAPSEFQPNVTENQSIVISDDETVDLIQSELQVVDSINDDIEKIDVPELEHLETSEFLSSMKGTISDMIENTETQIIELLDQQRRDLRDIGTVTTSMIEETQELLKLFGIPYVVAPMEAESQCAFLKQHNLVDGIVTDDSDIFLFGGDTVYKNMFDSSKYVESFSMNGISTLNLNRNQLIQMAYLLGSDYTEGILGLGPVSSVEIVTSWPSDDISGLQEFASWVRNLQAVTGKEDLNDDPTQRRLRSTCKKIYLPDNFPDPHIFQAYVKPVVDETLQEFQWGEPQLDALRTFLHVKLSWCQEQIDSMIVPVIKELRTQKMKKSGQRTVDEFFPITEKHHASKRVRQATAFKKGRGRPKK
ncbi:hypothetical protein BC833DRAFT_20924 [Globomyces pollinis-pini]|nr:hypothetical protein BC833DRAFT_20924 [Globomyces pollinis-pini]